MSVVMVVVGVLCVEKSPFFCVLCVCCYVLRPEEGIYYTHTHTERDTSNHLKEEEEEEEGCKQDTSVRLLS